MIITAGGTDVVYTVTANATPPPPTALTVTRFDDPDGDGDCPTDCSLRQAVHAIAPGGTVTVPSGIYTVSPSTTGIGIASSVNIVGAGAGATTITGGGVVRALNIGAGEVSISDLSITDGATNSSGPGESGYDGFGGLINVNNASLTLERVALSNGKALTAVDIDNGALDAAHGGAIFAGYSTVVVRDSSIAGSTSDGNGGAIEGGTSEVDVTNSTITGNTAAGSGGGIYASSGSLINDTIAANTAGQGATQLGVTGSSG